MVGMTGLSDAGVDGRALPACGESRSSRPDRSASVLDFAGDLVSQVSIRNDGDGFVLEELCRCRGRLTAYYFLRHGRRVALVSDDGVVRGILSTKWKAGRREWRLCPEAEALRLTA